MAHYFLSRAKNVHSISEIHTLIALYHIVFFCHIPFHINANIRRKTKLFSSNCIIYSIWVGENTFWLHFVHFSLPILGNIRKRQSVFQFVEVSWFYKLSMQISIRFFLILLNFCYWLLQIYRSTFTPLTSLWKKNLEI